MDAGDFGSDSVGRNRAPAGWMMVESLPDAGVGAPGFAGRGLHGWRSSRPKHTGEAATRASRERAVMMAECGGASVRET